MADVSAGFSVTETVKKKTSMLVAVINVEITKITASFWTGLDKCSNIDLFCYNGNI